MQFVSLTDLENGDASQTDMEAFRKCMDLPVLPENVVSLDYGFWGIKAFGPAAPNGITFRTITGVRARRSNLGNMLFTGAAHEIGLVDTVRGVDALFGQAADNEAEPASIKVKEGASLDLLQSFIMAALSKVVKPGSSRVWLVLGLTIKDMENSRFVAEVHRLVKGLFTFTSTGGEEFSVLVERINLQPQPAGALFDMVIDQDGKPSQFMDVIRQHPSAVIVTGGGTAEVYCTRPVQDDEGVWRMHVDSNRSDSRYGAGVYTMHNYLLKTVWNDLEARLVPSAVMIDRILEQGTWWDGTRDVDLHPHIERARKLMLNEVLALVESTIGLNNTDMRYIALAGGSMRWVQDDLASTLGAHRVFKPGQRPGLSQEENEKLSTGLTHPERVIARGLRSYGQFQLARFLESKR